VCCMIERRKSPRLRVLKRAKIIIGTTMAVDCVVGNITNVGARIRVPTAVDLPEAIDILFDEGRTFRTCRVVWRNGDEIGVEFFEPKAATYSQAIDAALTPCPKCQLPMIHVADRPHPITRGMQRSTYLCRPCNRTRTYILTRPGQLETAPGRQQADHLAL
jgi:hypothetical protein